MSWEFAVEFTCIGGCFIAISSSIAKLREMVSEIHDLTWNLYKKQNPNMPTQPADVRTVLSTKDQ